MSTHVGRAFERYEPESVDLVTNLWGAVDSVELRRIRDDVLSPELSGGIALDRVLEVLADAGLADRIGRVPQIATLQLVSPDHCMRADEFVYTRCRVFDR